MIFCHDPYDRFFRDPQGAVCAGADVLVRVCINKLYGFGVGSESVADTVPVLSVKRKFRSEENHFTLLPFKQKDGTLEYIIDGDILSRPGIYYYCISFGSENHELGRITVTDDERIVPEWFKNNIIYQIFPDRFAAGDDPRVVMKPDSYMYDSKNAIPSYTKDEKGNVLKWDFFGGNLQGISDNVSYLKRLGVGTVYLNPIFESVSNHRYDTADYEHVDGLLGGDGAFRDFIDVMSENGIRVILDGVFSHTGRESRYFKAALRGEKPYSDWYRFKDDGTYECWWGVEDLPCVNEMDPSYLEYTVTGNNSIVKRWLRAGASGWRLDVADELPDEYIEAIHKAARDVKKDAVIIGEVWEDGTDKVSYGIHRSYYTIGELDTQTYYPFRERLLDFYSGKKDSFEIAELFRADSVNYPQANYFSLVNLTGSHDVPRLFSCLKEITRGETGLAKGLLKAYSLIQFSFPGVPLIYYGDEVCMEGGTDPDNRRFFSVDGDNDGKMRSWFSELSSLRLRESVLRDGRIRFVNTGDPNVFAFERYGCGKEFLFASDRFGRGADFILNVLRDLEKVDAPVAASADAEHTVTGCEVAGHNGTKYVEKHSVSYYNIIKQADGYAVLLEKIDELK